MSAIQGESTVIGNDSVVAAQINIGNISAEGQSKYKGQEASTSVWTDYRIRHHYENDQHRYMMGITSPGGFQGSSVAFVQLAAPTLLFICDWTACRFNEDPIKPNPDLKNSDWVLLDKHYTAAMIVVGPDGVTPLHRISGTFVYGHKNPSQQIMDNMVYPLAPWFEDTFDRQVKSANQNDGIIGINKVSANTLSSPFIP